jgi:hypothetical protein
MTNKKTGDKRSNKAWFFLLIVAVALLLVAIFYRSSTAPSDDDMMADDGLTDKEKVDGSEEDVNSSLTDGMLLPVTEVTMDFDDYLVLDTNNRDIYYEREPVKGIFLTGYSAGSTTKLDGLIELANTTEVNAFVIDVKNDSGRVTFDVDIPLVDEIDSDINAINDIDGLMDKLYDNSIYPIARIVAFKDPYLSKNITDYAIKNQDGSLFYYHDVSWLNPYNEEVWAYVVDVAKEAAKAGFKEIQFDYIRFEASSRLKDADFGDIDESVTKMDVIVHFLDYAMAELEPYDVEVSADVFGTIITSQLDAKTIGQNYVEMSKRLDVICPMVYPSHYGYGYYGLPSSEPPDLHPYTIIYGAMDDSNEVLADIKGTEEDVIVRPWLQAFTASYLKEGQYMVYGEEAVKDQIQATYDAGLSEWLLWNPNNNYSLEWFEAK